MMITFLRHAETEFNNNNLFCGTSDCDITVNGKLLSENLRNQLSSFNFYYCSPLKRTWQTLNAIFPNADFIIDNRITEIHLGTWEGISKISVNQDLRNEFKNGNFVPIGAESHESVENRVISFLKSLYNTYTKDDKILVVTHNGFLRTTANLLGIEPVNKNLEYFTIDLNDYINIFNY